jgi:predicted RecB family nuclease
MQPDEAITGPIFAAFLECETKAHLLLHGAIGFPSKTQELRRSLEVGFKRTVLDRLRASVSEHEVFAGTPPQGSWRSGSYAFIIGPDLPFSQGVARPDALERWPQGGSRARAAYRPVRFSRAEKLTVADGLALAFDALAVAEVVGQTPSNGRVIHGPQYAAHTVPLIKGIAEARRLLKAAKAVLANPAPPPLALNKHCAVCEFQPRCREAAVESDDLSLLVTMSAKARKRQNGKGIFTVAQLSYTFRPPRRRRDVPGAAPKHDPALKALAIRTGRVHVIGDPRLTLAGTPVYLDVEGIPDRGFYYLVGLRFSSAGIEVQRSFWADGEADERGMWASCLDALKLIPDPHLVHYGSYETQFLKRMKARYCDGGADGAFVEALLSSAVNLVSLTFARIYLPTYSNGLKEIGRYLGSHWSEADASGASSLVWRSAWETSRDAALKERLVNYNAEDCSATQRLAEKISAVCHGQHASDPTDEAVNVGSIERAYPLRFGPLTYAVPEFKRINEAAYWDYQRSKIYIRSTRKAKRASPEGAPRAKRGGPRPNRVVRVQEDRPAACVKCGSGKLYKNGRRGRVTYDLRFSRSGVRLLAVQQQTMRYQCWHCKHGQMEAPRAPKYGTNLLAYVAYQLIELRISQRAVARNIEALFGIRLSVETISRIKTALAQRYLAAHQAILRRLAGGELVHADETQVRIGSEVHYVWVFTSLEEVAYVYSRSREASTVREVLRDFAGVLVSDFYSGYDGLECKQQKCLIHLLRDINEDLLKNPFNDEVTQIATEFAGLLRSIVDTIDRYGLKARHLHKHKREVERFHCTLLQRERTTEVAREWTRRFDRNRGKLFTFLDHDGVPWNNNNAEHAIKAFARLRNAIGSSSTPKGMEEYLVLLSISETCKLMGKDFLSFMRSGATGIAALGGGP